MTPPRRVVVLLENDATTRELYRRELARQYEVIACSTEREALESLQAVDADAIVLEPAALADEQWRFLVTVQQMPRYVGVPIVACSVLDARRRGLETGVDAYLIKPVTPALLATTLAGLLPVEVSQPSSPHGNPV